HSAVRDAAMGVSLERFMERYSSTAGRSGNRADSRLRLPRISRRNCRTNHQCHSVPGGFWCSVVETPYPPQRRTCLARSEDIPGLPKERDNFIVEFLTTGDLV